VVVPPQGATPLHSLGISDMRNAFRRFLEAIERLSAAVRENTVAMRENGPATERLETLELSLARWEAETEATLLKAEGKLQAANNAEARTRTMKRHVDKYTDPLDPDFEEDPTPIRPDYVEVGEAERVQPVHLGVAASDKTSALNTKFA